MANDNDLSFGFDTRFFDKGIASVTKKMEGLQTTTGTIAKGISRGLTSIALKFGSVFAGVKVVQGALKGMPEIGQAFGIAKDIFTKNLLFPLRKEIFPLLQKMLDWVRNSRGTFVRLGQTLANIFRSVVSGVKTIIGWIKGMSESVGGFIDRIFGKQFKSINEFFDLVSFKFATVIQFVSLLVGNIQTILGSLFSGMGDIGANIRGIVDHFAELLGIFTQTNSEGNSFTGVLSTMARLLGESLDFATRMIDKFLDGFVPAISGIATPLQGIIDTFGRIRDLIFTSTEAMKLWDIIFEGLGAILGGAIMGALTTIETVVKGIEQIIIGIQSIKDLGFLGAVKETGGNLLDVGKEGFNKIFGREEAPVATTATNNNRTQNNTANVNINPTITLQNGTPEEAENFAGQVMNALSGVFNREFERSGF